MSSHASRPPSVYTSKSASPQAGPSNKFRCNQNTCITATMTCYFWYSRSGNCTNQRCKYAHHWAPGMRIADKPQRVPGLNRAVAGRNLAMVEAAAAHDVARAETAARMEAAAAQDAARAEAAARAMEAAAIATAQQLNMLLLQREQHEDDLGRLDRFLLRVFPALMPRPRTPVHCRYDRVGDVRERLREMLREYQASVRGAAFVLR